MWFLQSTPIKSLAKNVLLLNKSDFLQYILQYSSKEVDQTCSFKKAFLQMWFFAIHPTVVKRLTKHVLLKKFFFINVIFYNPSYSSKEVDQTCSFTKAFLQMWFLFFAIHPTEVKRIDQTCSFKKAFFINVIFCNPSYCSKEDGQTKYFIGGWIRLEP